VSQEPVPKAKKRKGQVQVNESWCKGCGICVEFCPEHVLVIERGKSHVANPEACIACNMCELRCPDFAITVTPVDEKSEQSEK
jgi:2-oxoglutarate ferredoxin oxidoreductase subunit delta